MVKTEARAISPAIAGALPKGETLDACNLRVGFARSLCNTKAKLAIKQNDKQEFYGGITMKRLIRIVICIVASGIFLFLSGYGNLLNDISPSLAVTSFIGMTILFSIITILLWEMHLNTNEKINILSKEVNDLKEKIKKDNSQNR